MAGIDHNPFVNPHPLTGVVGGITIHHYAAALRPGTILGMADEATFERPPRITVWARDELDGLEEKYEMRVHYSDTLGPTISCTWPSENGFKHIFWIPYSEIWTQLLRS